METTIPSAESVRVALAPLTLKQLERLAELSTVPVSTIYKIKLGTTVNPGVETVRLFLPHIEEALREPTAAEESADAAAAKA